MLQTQEQRVTCPPSVSHTLGLAAFLTLASERASGLYVCEHVQKNTLLTCLGVPG